ncbi:regulator of sigma-W protease RasP [Erysipelotrichaceae bacterium]|nr:regulator of sigma-W protease RasP [Erysipelotrichaceae bacterium]
MNITSIFSVLVFLLILTIIVYVHELGHFLTAKKFGVYCKEFAIGMGTKIWGRQKGETLYSVRALPMGGFVQMVGEDGELFKLNRDDQVWLEFSKNDKIAKIFFVQPQGVEMAIFVKIVALEKAVEPMSMQYVYNDELLTAQCENIVYCYDEKEDEQWIVANNRQFTNIKPSKKIIVLAAGATMNFIFGFIFLFASTWIGGVNIAPIIATDMSENTATSFVVGDEILSVDGKTFPDFSALQTYIKANPSKEVIIKVARDAKEVEITRTLIASESQQVTKNGVEVKTVGLLGVTYERNHTNIIAILKESIHAFIGMFEYIFFVLLSLFTGKIKLTNLTGFVGIAQQTNMVITAQTAAISLGAKMAEIGARLLGFAAFLSINIGAMNLLPFPALDGGRIVFALYEVIFRKKVSAKLETYVNIAGFLLLIFVFIAITIQDVIRLFRP